MKATDILMDEHQVILRVITALETAVDKIDSGKVSPAFFLDASDFIKNFADGCHHVKEEGVLFKYMEAGGVPVQGGPIGVMLSDHEAGRQYNRSMRAGAEKWQAGDETGIKEIKVNAIGYANLLRSHIMREDNILFPMANRAIPAEKYDEVFEKFETVEHEETGEGVHEKYLALADKLEHEAAV